MILLFYYHYNKIKFDLYLILNISFLSLIFNLFTIIINMIFNFLN